MSAFRNVAIYAAETFAFTLVLYLLCSFVHMSFDPAQWHIITRTIAAVLVLLLVILVNYLIGKRGKKK